MVKTYLFEDNEKVFDLEYLEKLGVLYFKLDPVNYETDGSLEKVMKDNNYGHISMVTIKEGVLPDFEQKLAYFFEEHIHDHEEIRFIIEGCGFFDVRNEKDEWIRIYIEPGDLLVLPKGINHRFSLDDSRYAKVLRLFKADTEPVWVPFNRALPDTSKREAYLEYQGYIKSKFS